MTYDLCFKAAREHKDMIKWPSLMFMLDDYNRKEYSPRAKWAKLSSELEGVHMWTLKGTGGWGGCIWEENEKRGGLVFKVKKKKLNICGFFSFFSFFSVALRRMRSSPESAHAPLVGPERKRQRREISLCTEWRVQAASAAAAAAFPFYISRVCML